MADPVPSKPAIIVGTPLIAGNKQSLRLQITTDRTVRIAVPLGDAATALMTEAEFQKAQISLRPLSEPDKDGVRVEGVRRPEGLEELAPRSVDKSVGYIEIPITEVKVFVFNIWISDFVVQKDKGSVAIELRAEPDKLGDPWTLLDKQTAEKVVPEPRITSFTASRYNVGRGGSVTLDWTIEPVGNYELRPTDPLVTGTQKGNGQWVGNVVEGQQDFTLEAWAGEKPASPDTRRIHIDITSATYKPRLEFSPPNWPGSPGILGLYAHRRRGRLYALLRVPDRPYASLWYTEYGFDPSPRYWREATRKRDPKKPNEPVVKPLIPVEAALRPGAIFNDKLFLIGGDCCNPNSPGSGLGYCELNEDTGLDWQEVGDNEAWSWPKGMNERMGHAVVALPGEKGLWVMGGWRQDGGICDDVWQFNGTTTSPWEKVAGLELPRCLFGATATRAAVWTVGGFGSPGGTPNDGTVRRCAIGAKSWDDESMPEVPDISADYQYCASVLFSREDDGDKPYGIATFWNVKGNASERRYFYFEKKQSWENPKYFNGYVPEELAPSRNWYHMQSAVFRDAVFFRTLIPVESRADNKIYCFVFEPK
jgi:hypothetical protein